jgi:hypothetical protein
MGRTLRLAALAFIALAALWGCFSLPSPVSTAIASATVDWSTDAQQWKGNNGKTYAITLPPLGQPAEVWGTDVYTDDSSIGSAAVHKGLITFTNGGTVKIRILPGRGSYTGSTRNGVTSEDWDEWDGSFEFVTD